MKPKPPIPNCPTTLKPDLKSIPPPATEIIGREKTIYITSKWIKSGGRQREYLLSAHFEAARLHSSSIEGLVKAGQVADETDSEI
jgi:hypothetical protein